MKKTLLLLSVMAASAFSASAYDTFTAGTDEAPNYYLIRTERGNPFLSYSAEGVSNSAGGYVSHLTRLANATECSLWEVTPGSETGTVVIKNYAADVYLMNLSTTPADVTETATNIYVQQLENKAFSIGLATSDANFLDANNWNNNCGYWYPANGGTTWYATMVDLSNADDVISAIQAAQYGSDCESAQSNALSQLEGYAVAADIVADIINASIDDIKAVKPSATCVETINNIMSQAFSDANAILATGLNGKTYALKNLRRADMGLNPYFAANLTSNSYPDCVSMADVNALFEFKSYGENGYILYNAATKSYIAASQVPTTVEEEAQPVYPFLNTNSGYSGIAFAFAADHTGYGYNMNSWANSKLTEWSVNDGGSIWALSVFDEDAAVKEVTEAYISHLTEYAANVEPAADVLNDGISKLNGLKFSATLAVEAQAIETETLAAANAFLKTGLNQKSVQLSSLRNGYVIPNETPTDWTISEGVKEETYGYSVSATASDAANYDFVSGEDGGYTVYSPVTKRYFGPYKQNGGNKSIPQVDEADATLVYPELKQSGSFYGVAFALPADESFAAGTWGLNTNGAGLHSYYTTDAGSIFAIKIMGDATEIAEISATPAAQGIYDLSGRKLSAPVRGINIINGRKVLVK